MIRLRGLLALAFLACCAMMPAQAQRGFDRDRVGTWELLGEEKVGFGADKDRIEIRQTEAWWREKSFRALRFVAQGADIKVRRIILNYMNGHREELDYKGDMRAGQQLDLPLRGERSYLAAVEFDYATIPSLRFGSGGIRIGQATMRVYGENMRGGRPIERPAPPPLPPNARGQWETLASQRFDRRDGGVDMRVGRREGRIGQVRLVYNGDGGIVIRELRVRFGNGETQVIPLAERLEDGYSTRGIDLEGERRFIESVQIALDPRGRSGRANFTLEGTERPAREVVEPPRRGEGRIGRAGWELLGRQTVGFERGRDIIRINSNENWWRGGRDGGYDRLHFTAENNDLYMGMIRVTFINGVTEDIRVDREIRDGGELVVDLPGQRAYIRQIEMNYRARPGFRGQAIISVYGDKGRR